MFAPKIVKPQTQAVKDSARGPEHGFWTSARPQPGRDPAQQAPAPPHALWNFGEISIFAPDRAGRPPRPPGFVQAKLAVGDVDDPLEHEADRIADRVMRALVSQAAAAPASTQINRDCAASGSEDRSLRKKAGSGETVAEAPASVHAVLSSSGEPLDPAARAFFEPRFGCDFSKVRVHTDAGARASASELSSQAYTVGRNIVFRDGRSAFGTLSGLRLMAHELAHVAQRGDARVVRRAPPKDWSPTFGNLPRDEPHSGFRLRLEKIGGKWYEVIPGRESARRRAAGWYDFVVQGNEIWAERAKGPYGHTEAARGGRVSFAGQIRFTSHSGQISEWNERSGHYRPARSFAKNAGLPLDKFKPRPDPDDSGKVQLPVVQPDPDETSRPGETQAQSGGVDTDAPGVAPVSPPARTQSGEIDTDAPSVAATGSPVQGQAEDIDIAPTTGSIGGQIAVNATLLAGQMLVSYLWNEYITEPKIRAGIKEFQPDIKNIVQKESDAAMRKYVRDPEDIADPRFWQITIRIEYEEDNPYGSEQISEHFTGVYLESVKLGSKKIEKRHEPVWEPVTLGVEIRRVFVTYSMPFALSFDEVVDFARTHHLPFDHLRQYAAEELRKSEQAVDLAKQKSSTSSSLPAHPELSMENWVRQLANLEPGHEQYGQHGSFEALLVRSILGGFPKDVLRAYAHNRYHSVVASSQQGIRDQELADYWNGMERLVDAPIAEVIAQAKVKLVPLDELRQYAVRMSTSGGDAGTYWADVVKDIDAPLEDRLLAERQRSVWMQAPSAAAMLRQRQTVDHLQRQIVALQQQLRRMAAIDARTPDELRGHEPPHPPYAKMNLVKEQIRQLGENLEVEKRILDDLTKKQANPPNRQVLGH